MRKTSDSLKDFSFTNPTHCYFSVDKKGNLEQLSHKSVSDRVKLQLAIGEAINSTKTIYVTWAGRWSTDLFIVDTLKEMSEAFIQR